MLDYDIILNAKARLPKDAQTRIETRAKSLLDQITVLQFPLHWLQETVYMGIQSQIHASDLQLVREFYTNNETIANILSKSGIATCWINNGHNGYIIASPSSQKDGLLFYLEIGIVLLDYSETTQQLKD